MTVSDVLAEPLRRAIELGADASVRIGREALPDEAYDVVFECSGAAPAISAALAAVRRRGTVVQVGMVPNEARPVNIAPLISKEVSLIGVFRFRDEIDDAVRLLVERPGIEAVITHVFSVDEAVRAFEIAQDSTASGKVLVDLVAGR